MVKVINRMLCILYYTKERIYPDVITEKTKKSMTVSIDERKDFTKSNILSAN